MTNPTPQAPKLSACCKAPINRQWQPQGYQMGLQGITHIARDTCSACDKHLSSDGRPFPEISAILPSSAAEESLAANRVCPSAAVQAPTPDCVCRVESKCVGKFDGEFCTCKCHHILTSTPPLPTTDITLCKHGKGCDRMSCFLRHNCSLSCIHCGGYIENQSKLQEHICPTSTPDAERIAAIRKDWNELCFLLSHHPQLSSTATEEERSFLHERFGIRCEENYIPFLLQALSRAQEREKVLREALEQALERMEHSYPDGSDMAEEILQEALASIHSNQKS